MVFLSYWSKLEIQIYGTRLQWFKYQRSYRITSKTHIFNIIKKTYRVSPCDSHNVAWNFGSGFRDECCAKYNWSDYASVGISASYFYRKHAATS